MSKVVGHLADLTLGLLVVGQEVMDLTKQLKAEQEFGNSLMEQNSQLRTDKDLLSERVSALNGEVTTLTTKVSALQNQTFPSPPVPEVKFPVGTLVSYRQSYMLHGHPGNGQRIYGVVTAYPDARKGEVWAYWSNSLQPNVGWMPEDKVSKV